MNENANPNIYWDLVRALPHPTDQQVEAFVDHVSRAENWLKQLPLGGGPELTMLLDPNAGARVNKMMDTGRYFIEPLTPETELVHGSELPTDDYRKRFGFLNYYVPLGGGAAAVDVGIMVRALPPEPGVVHNGAVVPLPESIRRTACRPSAFLHGTFRGATGPGTMRRFRYAVERLAKLETTPLDDPLIQRIHNWIAGTKAQDEEGFGAWLRFRSGENVDELDAATRWQRYVEWRDDETCVRMHVEQDEEFRNSGIPEAVEAAHRTAVEQVRTSARAMLAALDGAPT